MEEGEPCKKQGELDDDAEEGEIIDDDDDDDSQQHQQPTTGASTTLSTNAPSITTTTTAFSYGNQGDKSGSGVITSGLTLNSVSASTINPSGSSSRETSSRSSSERSKKDENRSSSKKSDFKKGSSSTSGNNSGTSNNSTSGVGSSTSSSTSRNASSDKRKRRKHGKDEESKESTGNDSVSTKEQDENGLRPSKQRRASSREPGETNETGSSDDEPSDRTDSEDDSLDFNEEFFKGVIKQMEEMLKTTKDTKGQKKKREKLEKMMEKIKRIQGGSDTREMREIVRQNRRLFRPASRDRDRDRFDRFGPRGFRERRGRGGRMRDRMDRMDRMTWRDRDRRDFRDRDRDRDRDRFRDRDKMMNLDQSAHHHHHHHHQAQSQSQPQSQSQQQQQSQQVSSVLPSSQTTTSAPASAFVTTTTTSSTTAPSSQNLPVIPQHQALKENDREREKSPKNTCKFYLDGKCHKGADCPFPHDAPPPKKKDICKFYLQGFCGKGEGCLFMHGEFPCKFYHTGAECYSGDKCRFSHEPLTEDTRCLLKNYLDSGELPDEINRGDGSNHHTKPKRPAILGDPTQEMRVSYYTWLWQQEMKELEIGYTGTKRNLFCIDKEFIIAEKPPEPDGIHNSYYHDDSRDMRPGHGAGPKVLSYYIDTMSDPALNTEPSGPVNDDRLIEMSFHDEDLRLPPSSGIIPTRLPPPMGAPGPAIVESPSPYTNYSPNQSSSSNQIISQQSNINPISSTPFDPHLHQPALNSNVSSTSMAFQMPPAFSNSTPSNAAIASGPPPLLPMQPELVKANINQPSSFSSSYVNNHHSASNSVMSEEMPLPPLKENLPPVTSFPSSYQESSNLGPPPPLYAVNNFNGPPSIVSLENNLSSSSTSNQAPITSPVQSFGRDDTNQLGHENLPNSTSRQHQNLNSFSSSLESTESVPSSVTIKTEPGTNIPDNLPLAARNLLQRLSNNQKTGASEDSESGDLLINESNIKSEITSMDSILRPPDLAKTLDDNREVKQLLSDSDDDTEDEPVKAALKNLKDTPNIPATIKPHDSLTEKKPNKTKLDIAKMLNVIRQTTIQVTSTQPTNTTNDKHADFWQNILSGTNLANTSPATLGSSNSQLDFRDSRSKGSDTPPLPGSEPRDPRLKRSSKDSLSDCNSSFSADSIIGKSSDTEFKSDFDYRLYSIPAPKIDYSPYEGLFNSDVKLKTDPRLQSFFKKNYSSGSAHG
ncbi:uncharacterized protein LOC107371516 [Tetranychus urticae]|uniref:C3H1-type domain-containing protein n=1 Tax=Tetranychus urticae TaxID=32264 RepID=T1JW87_TETUR|nr:uncharacterized protein LOC107371516 [Tetranychus urticae]